MAFEDPTRLFEHEVYLEAGFLMWPDSWPDIPGHPYEWFGLQPPAHNVAQAESGQVLFNRSRDKPPQFNFHVPFFSCGLPFIPFLFAFDVVPGNLLVWRPLRALFLLQAAEPLRAPYRFFNLGNPHH
jgi:hypothetical protein